MSDADERGHTPGLAPNSTATRSLSVDEQCELLASSRRRAILRYVTASPGDPVDVDELADFLLASGEGTDRRTVVRSLRHNHLPALADAGVVSYRRDQRQLTYRGARELEALLDFLDSRG